MRSFGKISVVPHVIVSLRVMRLLCMRLWPMPVCLLLTRGLGSDFGPGQRRYDDEEVNSGMRDRFLGGLWWSVDHGRDLPGEVDKRTRGSQV